MELAITVRMIQTGTFCDVWFAHTLNSKFWIQTNKLTNKQTTYILDFFTAFEISFAALSQRVYAMPFGHRVAQLKKINNLSQLVSIIMVKEQLRSLLSSAYCK